MITLREGTTFDAAAPGDVAWVAEKSKDENLEAREIYAQKPYHDVWARVETHFARKYSWKFVGYVGESILSKLT
jgi:hypothetical protein